MTAFEDLVARATADLDVLGVILTGSAARGMATEHSDHDVMIIVSAFSEAWPEPMIHTPELDTIPYLIEWLSDTSVAWTRWQFRGARVLLDRTEGAQLADLCAGRARLTPEEADRIVREYVGGYINSSYRAAKSRRDGRPVLAQLDTMESAAYFLQTLFALHGRVRPYNKYLRWELENYPLGEPWDAETLPERVAADPLSLFDDLEALARARGYADEYDSWQESELALLRRRPPAAR